MILLLTLPVFYLIWRGVRGRRVEVTHRETFTLGYLWYGALPLFLSGTDVELDSPALRGWRSIANLMGPEIMRTELIWSVAIWAAFIAGTMVVPRVAATTSSIRVDEVHPMAWRTVLLLIGIGSLTFAIAWGVVNRGLLFGGYEANGFDDVVRGPLQASLLYTSVAAIIAYLRRHAIGNTPAIVNGAAVLIMILLSLSVGTRGAAVLAVLMAVAVASKVRGGLSRKMLVIGGLASVTALAALAAWRLGSSDIAFAALSPALESLYTYFSAATYLTFNAVPIIAFPSPLLGGIGNLVPRALWPDKGEYLGSLLNGVKIFAPVGALHLFASLLVNFGWLGSIVAAFFAGAAVERLSRSQRPACIAAFALIVGVLTTDLWRNPFSQSLIKSVLQGAVLIPLLLTFAALVATRLRGSARRHIDAI